MAIGEHLEGPSGTPISERSPDPESSATACQRNLIRAGLLAEARVVDAVRPYGLTGPTFHVLMIVHGAGQPLSPWQISDRMVMPRNTLTHILDALEQQELVRRQRHPHHRGMVLVELTEKGRDLVDDVLPRLHARDEEWWASFSEHERQTLLALLRRAQEALAASEATAHAERQQRHRHGHHHLHEHDEWPDQRSRHEHHSGDPLGGTLPSRKESDEIDA